MVLQRCQTTNLWHALLEHVLKAPMCCDAYCSMSILCAYPQLPPSFWLNSVEMFA